MASSVEQQEPAQEAEVEAPAAEEDGDNSRTFPLDVASQGADRLRSTVKIKLSEFMGSYTDDVLAEYVVVLVGHGKQRKQATADLEAFLGVQSEAFVSWLWAHLTDHLHDYIQESDHAPEEIQPCSKQETESQQEVAKAKKEVAIETRERVESTKKAKDDKTVENPGQEEARQELKRARSPEPRTRRLKTRTENKESKKEASPQKDKLSAGTDRVSPPRLKASRRLLEFAVRDAVAPASGATRRKTDAMAKRLRSVVSTDHENSGALLDSNGKLKARPSITKQAKNSPAMMIALKAAAAAAEDVSNRKTVSKPVSRFNSSVWDRLGGKSDEDIPDHQNLEDAEEEITEKMEYVHVDDVPRNSRNNERHLRRSGNADRQRASPAPVSHHSYDYDHDDQQFERRIEEVPESLTRKESSKRHGLRKERRQKRADESVHHKRVSHMDLDVKQKDILPLERRSKADYQTNTEDDKCIDMPNGKDQDLQDVTEMKKRMRQVELEVTKLRTRQDEAVKVSEKATTSTPVPPANPPPSLPPAPSVSATTTSFKVPQSTSEDPDSRMVLVTNVHFATTKEAISTHFGPCGDVVKVTMLTDGVSGKPKGSAYVEFSSRDGADRALALNESCLLSRPLRVVRKDANVAETSSSIMRPPIMRPVRMPPMRAFPRAGFMRGSPYMIRPPPRLVRPPYPVAPHLQWKRDAGSATATNQMGPPTAVKNGFRSNVGPIRLKRSMSYVRPVVPPTPPEAALSTSTEEQKGT